MFAKELDPNSHLMQCSLTLMIVSLLYDKPFIAEWDDDMTYLYVDYPFYKRYTMFATLVAVRLFIKLLTLLLILVHVALQL